MWLSLSGHQKSNFEVSCLWPLLQCVLCSVRFLQLQEWWSPAHCPFYHSKPPGVQSVLVWGFYSVYMTSLTSRIDLCHINMYPNAVIQHKATGKSGWLDIHSKHVTWPCCKWSWNGVGIGFIVMSSHSFMLWMFEFDQSVILVMHPAVSLPAARTVPSESILTMCIPPLKPDSMEDILVTSQNSVIVMWFSCSLESKPLRESCLLFMFKQENAHLLTQTITVTISSFLLVY